MRIRQTADVVPSSLLLIAFVVIAMTSTLGQNEDDLNVYMMQSTVKLQGSNSLGTGFILLRPLSVQTGPPGTSTGKMVLITAAHILEEMSGDQITVSLRSRDPQSIENWIRRPYILPIRRNGQRLWTRHAEADVAVMYVAFDVQLFDKAPTVDLLATDDLLQKYQVNPGVELNCAGFPLGAESNPAGFPILRTGDIASYPLTPTAQTNRGFESLPLRQTFSFCYLQYVTTNCLPKFRSFASARY
jgi:hypothetical protein